MKYEDEYKRLSNELVEMIGAETFATIFYMSAKGLSFEMRSDETPQDLVRRTCRKIVRFNLDELISHMTTKFGSYYFIGLNGDDLAEVLMSNLEGIWRKVNFLLHCDVYQAFPEPFFKTELENLCLVASPRSTFNQYLNYYDELKAVSPAKAEAEIRHMLAIRALRRLSLLLPDWADEPTVFTTDGANLKASLEALNAKVGRTVRGKAS